jgi:hypothetical protein
MGAESQPSAPRHGQVNVVAFKDCRAWHSNLLASFICPNDIVRVVWDVADDHGLVCGDNSSLFCSANSIHCIITSDYNGLDRTCRQLLDNIRCLLSHCIEKVENTNKGAVFLYIISSDGGNQGRIQSLHRDRNLVDALSSTLSHASIKFRWQGI